MYLLINQTGNKAENLLSHLREALGGLRAHGKWQGAGVGTRFLNGCAEMWLRGENRYHRPLRTLINTSHPGLAAALRRNPQWTQVSAALYGADKLRCRDSLRRSALKHGKDTGKARSTTGYGGHFRAVQGFRYLGNGQEE